MLSINECINNLNESDWYNKEIKKSGIIESFKTVKKFETLFYSENSKYSKNTSTPLKEELCGKITPLKLYTEDGICLDVWDINPEFYTRYVIICQGINSEKSNILLQQAYIDFLKNGWGILVFDYRGRGASSGEFSAEGAYTDVCTVYQYLMEKGIHSDHTGIIGHSMGTGVALDFTAHNNVAFLILLNPFSIASDMAKNIAQKVNIPHAVRKAITFMPSFLIPLKNKFNNIRTLSKIKRPVLILHNKKDGIIPVELARKLYNNSKNFNVTYFELSDDDHEMNKQKTEECICYLKHIDTYTSKLIYNSVR